MHMHSLPAYRHACAWMCLQRDVDQKLTHLWTLPEMVACEAKFGCKQRDNQPPRVILVEQGHMTMVRVPPGWIHAVTNVKVRRCSAS